VKAVRGDSFALLVQHRVGGGRSVAGYHLERLGRIQPQPQIAQQIEQTPIHLMLVAGPVIAQHAVDVRERFGEVLALCQ